MVKEITVNQAEVTVDGKVYTVTHIPTATSGCWYTVHDLFELWAAVAIDLDGRVAGWRNPPSDRHRKEFEKAIKKAFGIGR